MSQETRKAVKEAAEDASTANRYLRRAATKLREAGDHKTAQQADSAADGAAQVGVEITRQLEK